MLLDRVDAGDVLLLWHTPLTDATAWLACDAAALDAVLGTAPAGAVVGFAPDDLAAGEVEALVAPAIDALADDTAYVAARLEPVNEAVKRVDAGRVVGSVDRSTLRRVSGPAFVRRDDLARVLRSTTDEVVRPVLAVAADGRIAPLEASGRRA